jgi:glycosyltransferase involved in cell wall biosynthesis
MKYPEIDIIRKEMTQVYFSIIIPTYNRPEQLAQCLQSLVYQTYNHDYFEVIIVDDGSEISLSELVLKFYDKLNITLLTQQNAGPATARNTGAAQAKGQFLAFTDDDCELESNWLKNLAISFKENPNVAIGGKTINNLPKNIYAIASQLLVDYLYNYHELNNSDDHFFTTNNFSLSKKLFNSINGFNINFTLAAAEDREFCYRWLNNGYQMIYAPKVVVYHNHAVPKKLYKVTHL